MTTTMNGNDQDAGQGPPDPHRQAWELMPWVINGTAEEAERELLGAHLQGCGDCRAEFDFQQSLREGIGSVAPAAGLDVDRALQGFWAKEGIQAPQPMPNKRPRQIQRWLVAAVAVQAIGLAGLGSVIALRSGGGAEYQVLTQAEGTPSAASLRIVPAPGMQMGELRALLARSDLQLVQASADGGHFGLALAPGARFSREQALQRLRAEPGILLAEPVTAAGGN